MALCSKCRENERRPGQRYCRDCHNAASREWKRAHPLKGEARRKSATRAYANVYQKRGKLRAQPCEVCGGKAEKHHDDYGKPLEVRWLCRKHHLEHHAQERAPALKIAAE